jgi:hypothetical protein
MGVFPGATVSRIVDSKCSSTGASAAVAGGGLVPVAPASGGEDSPLVVPDEHEHARRHDAATPNHPIARIRVAIRQR